MEVKDLTYQDIRTILAASLGVREWNIDDVSGGFVYYRQEDSSGNGGRVMYKRSYAIADSPTGTKVTLGDPVQVVKRTIYEPLVIVSQFSLDGEAQFADDGMVRRIGKIFMAGDYPDKNFSITEEELKTAAAEFSPVDNDLEHRPTILSGKLGQLKSVVAKGKELYGAVDIPKWLNDQIGSDPLKVSLAWSRDTKRIVGNALVLEPKIKDAQLMAAFTAAQSDEEGGTTVTVPKPQTETGKRGWFEKLRALFAEKKLPEGFEDFNPEEVMFSDDQPKHPDPAPDKPEEPSGDAVKFAAQRDAAMAKSQGLEARLIQVEAEKFADSAIADRKAFPAERDSLVAQFKQAVIDDNAGVACFSETGELIVGSRVKLLKDSVGARPTHNLTTEQIAGADLKDLVLMSANSGPSKEGELTPERRKELLSMGSIKPQIKEDK